MSVTGMKKLTAIVLQADAPELLTALSALHATEILPSTLLDAQGEPLSALTASAADARAEAARIDELVPIFAARLPRRTRSRRTPIPTDTAEFIRSGTMERTVKIAGEATRLLAYIKETTDKKAAEQAEMAALLPYLSHPFSLDDEGTRSTTILLGSLPVGTTVEALNKAAVAVGFVFDVLSTDKSGVYIAAMCHHAMQDEVTKALEELGFQRAAWRNTNGRATTLFDAAGARAAALDSELSRANAQLDSLAQNLTDVKILRDVLHAKAELAAYQEKMQSLGSCAVLSCWCPTHECARVTALLDELREKIQKTTLA